MIDVFSNIDFKAPKPPKKQRNKEEFGKSKIIGEAERKRILREHRILKGLCTECGIKKSTPGLKTCKKCRTKKEKRRKTFIKNKTAYQCHNCCKTLSIPLKSKFAKCEECKEAERQWKITAREQGICLYGNCGKDVEIDSDYCSIHSEKMKLANKKSTKKRREYQRANGLCECGTCENEALPGKPFCKKHYEKNKEYQRNYYYRRKKSNVL